jgi:coenzyme PQQ precursor peptide PqqA
LLYPALAKAAGRSLERRRRPEETIGASLFWQGIWDCGTKILCIAAFSGVHGGRKDSAGELFDPYYLIRRAEFVRFHLRRAKMAWKAPKIVEVPVGMEINMYACAARK